MSNSVKELLLQDFASLLQRVGTSLVSPSAYDTAWVARIPIEGRPNESVFPEALAWIANNQHKDGSWGEGGVAERLMATLIAVIALNEKGHRARDAHQAELGLSFVWRSLPQLQNSAILPVGFELILGALIDEGRRINLNLPSWLGAHYEPYRRKKMQLLERLSPEQLRHTSATFSLEFLGSKLGTHPEDYVRPSGVGVSPSATASVLRYVTDPEVRHQMIQCLTNIRISSSNGDGWSNFTTFNLFETIWVLYNLRISRCAHTALLQPYLMPHLDLISENCRPDGIPMATDFIADGDNTLVGYTLLSDYKRHYDASPLESYWKADHLIAYNYERDASPSVNIHGVETYHNAGNTERVKQLLNYLDVARQGMPFWMDKWHTSPYYTTSYAVIATAQLDTDLYTPALDWIIFTQNENGSWGYETETAEETAYALQAIFYYADAHGWNNQLRSSAQAGAEYLRTCYRPFVMNEPPLWVGKNRFTPYLIVRSTIIASLLLADSYNI